MQVGQWELEAWIQSTHVDSEHRAAAGIHCDVDDDDGSRIQQKCSW